MRIGHFVPVVSRLPGYERNVSGHIQIPLHAMQVLGDHGHDVHLITNSFGDDRVLPWCMPTAATVHYVRDSRRRLGSLEKKRAPVSGVYPVAFLRQVGEIRRIAQREQLDLLHLHGHLRTSVFAAVLKLLGLRIPTVATLFALRMDRCGPINRRLLRRAGSIVTATEHVAGQCRELGADVHIVRHGLVRDIRSEMDESVLTGVRHRVLFWRDLTHVNGADIAVQAFDRLAPEFPDVSFNFAVRPQLREVDGVEELCARHANVHLYRFPYPSGISLANLLGESLAVVLPFRSFTIQPQLSIAESMSAGAPVVATDVGSTAELITHGETGMVCPVGDGEATTNALRELLRQPDVAHDLGAAAAAEIARSWNWDTYAHDLEDVYRAATQGR